MEFINTIQHWLKNPAVGKLIQVCIVILVITLIVRALRNSVSHYIQDNDTRYHLRKTINLIGYGFIFLFAASIFSDNFRQLTVIFGVIGAGVAFALQEVIASFAGWVAISLGQFYKPGDRVLLGGIRGDVIDISILRTTIMECGDWVKADLYNGRIVRIANSFVFKEPVFNYSADFPFVWDEITLPVKYGSDRRLTKEIIQRVADNIVGEYVSDARGEWQNMVHKYLIEDARIEPAVTLIANDNWMEFTLRYVVDYKKRRGKKDELFTKILDEIDLTEGRVAIASTTIHLVETPTLNIKVSKNEE
ncbi:mechanosensitive ion channel family protein [Anabaena sp. PCC 7108]|uniref:mechanosensitive ion channel family protein n=1 Tax=Anabaena sp. PCC 7108 TaxID=163908 RepID=UPI00034C1E53|nr:mechanosensitive ion channel domain-containing protein [Anabaena sp. PCC 7108]